MGINEKEAFAQMVNDDTKRHLQDEEMRKAERSKGTDMMMQGLASQQAELSRRAYESRVREAQEAAEMKMRTVQQMCEELAEANRRKKQLQEDLDKGMKNN